MGGDGLDGWDVCSVQLWKLDPFKAKWTDRLSSIMLDWEMGECCMFLGGAHGKVRMELGSNGS
jgi:hypothetical protein